MPLRQKGLPLLGQSLELLSISSTKHASLLHLRARGATRGSWERFGGQESTLDTRSNLFSTLLQKKTLAGEMHGWSCKPFLCWKQHLVASPTHPSSCPWSLAVWGHEGDATAGESSPLRAASAGSFPSKGSLCLSLLGVLGISLCVLSKHERVVGFCQDRRSCSGLC